MKGKITTKKVIGIVGAFLFALSLMISNVPSDVIANQSNPGNCSGTKIQCVSHLPDRLP